MFPSPHDRAAAGLRQFMAAHAASSSIAGFRPRTAPQALGMMILPVVGLLTSTLTLPDLWKTKREA
jgi:hypothetical protein